MRWIVGFIGTPFGFLIVYYRERIKNFTGDFAWAEKNLGPGGTYTVILIVGLIVAIGSMLYMFGVLQGLLFGIFGRFLPGVSDTATAP